MGGMSAGQLARISLDERRHGAALTHLTNCLSNLHILVARTTHIVRAMGQICNMARSGDYTGPAGGQHSALDSGLQSSLNNVAIQAQHLVRLSELQANAIDDVIHERETYQRQAATELAAHKDTQFACDPAEIELALVSGEWEGLERLKQAVFSVNGPLCFFAREQQAAFTGIEDFRRVNERPASDAIWRAVQGARADTVDLLRIVDEWRQYANTYYDMYDLRLRQLQMPAVADAARNVQSKRFRGGAGSG